MTIDERRGEAPLAGFLQARQPWVERRLCDTAGDAKVFFDATEHHGAMTRCVNTSVARAICRSCPVRPECGTQALVEEEGLPVGLRFGIRAYMTPAQRESVERRGGLRPGQDPVALVLGRDGKRSVPPVPDDGDRWSRHHTTLARKAVRWISEHTAVGEQLPTQTKLCELLSCNPAPLRRVMEALVQDGTLDFAGTKTGRPGANGRTVAYVRRGSPRAVGSWLPIHMLTDAQGSSQ